jgi:hypothetical protein
MFMKMHRFGSLLEWQHNTEDGAGTRLGLNRECPPKMADSFLYAEESHPTFQFRVESPAIIFYSELNRIIATLIDCDGYMLCV